MKFGQHDFRGRNFFSRMDINGDAATVINHGDAVVDVNSNFDVIAMSGERFVDGVIDNFIDQMM